GDYLAVDLVCRARKMMIVVDQVLHLGQHLPDQLAIVLRLDPCQIVSMLTDAFRDLPHDSRPFQREHRSPRSLKSLSGGPDRAVHVLWAGRRESGPDFTGVRVDRAKSVSGMGIQPFPANVH